MALPKPAKVKLQEGNRAKVAISKLKHDPKGIGVPRLPPYLNDEEEMMWLDVVASLPDGILSAADDGILERYVVAWARFRKVRRALEESSYLLRTARGPVKNPLLSVLAAAEKAMHAAGGELGLSPVARARMAALETFHDDPMAMLLGGTVNDNDANWSDK